MDSDQANTVASNDCEVGRRGRKLHTFKVTTLPPGCIPSEIVVYESDSSEDLAMTGTSSASSLLDFPRFALPAFSQNGQRLSTGDPPKLHFFSKQTDSVPLPNEPVKRQQQPHRDENMFRSKTMAAIASTEIQEPTRQANSPKTSDALPPFGWRREHSTENLLRVRKEAWSETMSTGDDSLSSIPSNQLASPSKKTLFRLSRVSLAPFFDRMRERRGATKVQPIEINMDRNATPEEQVKTDCDKGGNSQVSKSEGATAIQKLPLVQSDASMSNVLSSMADTRNGQQLALGQTSLASKVEEPSNIAEGLLATACTSFMKDCSINPSLYLQYDDMMLASFLSADVADRRVAICEELEGTLNIVKINGCMISLLELREDLASFLPLKTKSLKSSKQ